MTFTCRFRCHGTMLKLIVHGDILRTALYLLKHNGKLLHVEVVST